MGVAGKAHRRKKRVDGARERGTENQAGARKSKRGMGTAELAGKES